MLNIFEMAFYVFKIFIAQTETNYGIRLFQEGTYHN